MSTIGGCGRCARARPARRLGQIRPALAEPRHARSRCMLRSMVGQPVTARACANIALVKYWGKADAALNLPATGSLSLTLAALTSTATVRFDERLDADRMELDGAPASSAVLARTSGWLDLVRQRAGISARAEIASAN